eukprot:6189088-Pleurochrysis_carterae.AAC.1
MGRCVRLGSASQGGLRGADVVSGTSPMSRLWPPRRRACRIGAQEMLYMVTTDSIKFKAKSWIDVFGGRASKATPLPTPLPAATAFPPGDHHHTPISP